MNVALYVPLGITAVRALSGARIARWSAALTLVIGTVLSGSVEMLQIYTPTRQCSGFDLVSNIAGTGIGIAAATAFRLAKGTLFAHHGDSAARVLLGLFLAYLLFPFFPVTHVPVVMAGLTAFAHAPWLQPRAFVLAFASWCAAGRMMRSAGFQAPSFSIAAALLLIPLQFAIVSRAPLPATALGAACGVLLCLSMGTGARAQGIFAAAFPVLLLIAGLSPFEFTASNQFTWIPFGGILASGDWQRGFLALLEKAYLYSAAVWLLHRAGLRLPLATLATAAVLAALEALQLRIPGHVAEVTDPLLAIASGVAIHSLRRKPAVAR